MKTDVTWKIGGEAGFGIISAGTMLAKAFAREGYCVEAQNEYPSLIRGGHNVITVRISTDSFTSLINDLHILVALNKETVSLHKEEVSEHTVVFFDPQDAQWETHDFSSSPLLIPIPLSDIAKQLGGEAVVRNTIALGATIALLGADFSILEVVIRDQFEKKGQSVVEENIQVAKAGFDFVKKEQATFADLFLEKPKEKKDQLVMNASEALGLGALEAGMKFAAIYPMTPINALIPLFTDFGKARGVVYKQPEDEIAGINMALGASLAGVRSMVATSGGGFALMVEGVSLAGIMEVPLVIDLGMRPGPATGMPTWTEQGELQMVVRAGHGEFPRIVLAPGDAEETYRLGVDAFELADAFQIPVFILTDKYLNENQWCVARSVFSYRSPLNRGKIVDEQSLPSDGSFKRYDLSVDDGVSPRSLPGMEHGKYLSNSYEHEEKGFTTEDSEMRIQMAKKRLRKAEEIKKHAPMPHVYGDAESDITFVSFGSTKGPILEAMKRLKQNHVSAKLIHFSWVYPLPATLGTMLASEKRLIDIEGNGTGQLADLIRQETGIEIKERLHKFDGRQWMPEEIIEGLKKSANDKSANKN